MQITKAEALDIYQYLSLQNLINPELIVKLESTVKDYRLNVEMPALGKNINLRRTYTCSFYTPGATGCSLPFEVKPLGCLAFNPIEEKSYERLNCVSDQKLLEQVSEADNKKLPIPMAVLEIIKQNNVNG
jgi:Fe-S-cluster containining protein